MLSFWILSLFVTVCFGRHEEYEEHKMFKISSPLDTTSLELLNIILDLDGVNSWVDLSPHHDGFVSVSPKNLAFFEEMMTAENIQHELVVNNIASALKDQDKELQEADDKAKLEFSDSKISFGTYPRYYQINDYLDHLAKTHPDKVQVITAGKSYEGRDINYLRISTSGFKNSSRPVVYVDAGIHAREWIAPITSLYIIDKLVTNITEKDLASELDWIVLPLVNPDGYEYTFEKDRNWRKTRSSTSSRCVGVDGNRNFDVKWMVSGSSSNACSDIYAGPKPHSEPEISTVSNILQSELNRIKLLLTIHSYGSYILYPWGHDGSSPANVKELDRIGKLAGRAIDAASTLGSGSYTVGNSANVLYPASGGTDDYGMSIGIPLAYTIELPGFRYGFELPPKYIKPVVEETWQGVATFAREVLKSKW